MNFVEAANNFKKLGEVRKNFTKFVKFANNFTKFVGLANKYWKVLKTREKNLENENLLGRDEQAF